MAEIVDLHPVRPFRRPPHNVEAEMALIGAILVNNAVYDRVAHFVAAEHFAVAEHGRIYEMCRTMIDRGDLADPITLKHHAEANDDLADIGGAPYLKKLMDAAVTVINAVEYARVVVELHARRELIAMAQDAEDGAYTADMENPTETRLNQLQDGIMQILDVLATANDEPGDGITRTAEVIDRAHKTRGQSTGVQTGLVDLDRLIVGLPLGGLTLLGGRPSMGKTALALNIATDVAKRTTDRLVAFFSAEMSEEELRIRLASDATGIPMQTIRQGGYEDDGDVHRVVAAVQAMRDLPLVIDDRAGLSVGSIRAKCREIKRKHRKPLALVVVDYLQLLTTSSRRRQDNRVQEVSEMSRALKILARDLKVPVLCLSQLSRALETRDNKRPMMSDLRESGSLEQDADIVLFVYRDAYYLERARPDHSDHVKYYEWQGKLAAVENKAEVIVAKNRQGATGTAELYFRPETTRFGNLQRGPQESPPWE